VIRPLEPVTSKHRAAYGLAFFVLFVALWAWATFGGYVSKTFLANPLTMLQEGFELLTKHGFLFDIGMTIWRVVGGFLLAAIIAVPLGVLMGAFENYSENDAQIMLQGMRRMVCGLKGYDDARSFNLGRETAMDALTAANISKSDQACHEAGKPEHKRGQELETSPLAG